MKLRYKCVFQRSMFEHPVCKRTGVNTAISLSDSRWLRSMSPTYLRYPLVLFKHGAGYSDTTILHSMRPLAFGQLFKPDGIPIDSRLIISL